MVNAPQVDAPTLSDLDQEVVAQARHVSAWDEQDPAYVAPAPADQTFLPLPSSDPGLVAAAQRCVNAYVKVAHNLYGCSIGPVKVTFDLCDRKPNSAGEASRGAPAISLNMILFRDYVEKFLNVVIPHEVAHLMQFDKFDNKGFETKGHGPEWKEAMRRLGQEPAKFSQDIDTTKAVLYHKQLKQAKRRVRKIEV